MKPIMSQKEISAVIVRLHIGTFTNSCKDVGITNEVRLAKSLGRDAGGWRKNKFPPKAFATIAKMGGLIRAWHYSQTLPWEFGYRLLTAQNFSAYNSRLEEFQAQYLAVAESDFGSKFDFWISEAKKMHAKKFCDLEYPRSWDSMKSKLCIRVEHSPVPKAEEFAIKGIAAKAVSDMREEMQNRVNKNMEEAMQNTWFELLAPVRDLAAKLANQDTKIYRDSLIDNLKDIVARIPALNLAGDNRLTRAAAQNKERLASVKIETLKESVEARTEAGNAAQEIISQFGNLGKRKILVD
jgi:hypothetical protein